MMIYQERYFILPFFLLSIIIFVTLTMTMLTPDVTNLLHDTNLFLLGGTYVKDFFETNPPMIFLIYSPVVIFSKISSIPISFVMTGYTILCAWLSITICSILLKKIIKNEDVRLRYSLLFVLTFMFLLLPSLEFSQREHFLMIFMMPYLFLAVLAAQGKTVHPGLAIIIGMMAAFGFGLKPYFLPTLILVEVYLMFVKRNASSCLRIESLVCASMLLLYLGFIFQFHPNYIYTLLPLLNSLYFPSIKQPWLTIFMKPTVLFGMGALAYYILLYKRNFYRDLSIILLLSMCGMILAVIIPRAAWWYHAFPAFGLSCLLVTMFVCQIFYDNALSKKEICFVILAVFLVPFKIYMGTVVYFIKYVYIFKNNALVEYLHHSKEKTIHCFATTTLCNTLAKESGQQYVGRFSIYWWVRILMQLEAQNTLNETARKQKNYLIHLVVEDLNRYQPDLLVVYSTKLTSSLNMLEYFLQDESFRDAWKYYHTVKSFGVFTVYERVD